MRDKRLNIRKKTRFVGVNRVEVGDEILSIV